MFYDGYYPALFQLASVGSVDFAGCKMDARAKAYLQMMREDPRVAHEHSQFKLNLIAVQAGDEPPLICAKKIEKIEDYKELKLRVTGYGGIAARAPGATPVGVVQVEVYEAMQRGAIDACGGSHFDSMINSGMHTTRSGRHWGDTGVGGTSTIEFIINLDSYNKLPPAIRAIIDEEFEKLTIEDLPKLRTDNVRDRMKQALKDRPDIVIYSFSDALKEQVRAIAQKPVHDAWVNDRMGGMPKNAAEAALKRFMELYKQYDAGAPLRALLKSTIPSSSRSKNRRT